MTAMASSNLLILEKAMLPIPRKRQMSVGGVASRHGGGVPKVERRRSQKPSSLYVHSTRTFEFSRYFHFEHTTGELVTKVQGLGLIRADLQRGEHPMPLDPPTDAGNLHRAHFEGQKSQKRGRGNGRHSLGSSVGVSLSRPCSPCRGRRRTLLLHEP
jgi:hypothetical protein